MHLMMDRAYRSAFILGYERMAAWSDVLDQINIFPVPDADTGRNLKISLAALQQIHEHPVGVSRQILRTATGNAGNIAAAFLHELLKINDATPLSDSIQAGMRAARKAVADPKPGTMLTLFETLAQAIPPGVTPASEWDIEMIIGKLEACVNDTTDMLPALTPAGVVDAGALGMFLFLEAFLLHLSGLTHLNRPLTDRFNGKLHIANDWQPRDLQPEHCLRAVIRPHAYRSEGSFAHHRPRRSAGRLCFNRPTPRLLGRKNRDGAIKCRQCQPACAYHDRRRRIGHSERRQGTGNDAARQLPDRR